MRIEQILQGEIEESRRALDGSIDDTIYRRDHSKRQSLILERVNPFNTYFPVKGLNTIFPSVRRRLTK